jgi:hypothetical protein
MTRGRLADDGKNRAGDRIGGPHRIAIHGGSVEGRLVTPSDKIFGEYPAIGFSQRNVVDGARAGPDQLCRVEQPCQSLGNRHEGHQASSGRAAPGA